MSFRTFSPAVGRVLTGIAALIVVAGIANCASFSGRNTLDGILDAPGLTRAHASLDEILLGANGTYIDRILAERDSTIERWPEYAGQPLRIWIDSTPLLSGLQTEYPQAVRAAFQQWETTGIGLQVVYVTNPRDADVRVRWTDHLSHKTGSTTWRTDHNGWITSSDITLATHISDGQLLDDHGMRAIALHEVGHALGLSHSEDPRDIMAPLVRVDGLSASDRSTIKLLYSLPAGHVG